MVTEVLAAGEAIGADAVGVAQPRNPDPLAEPEALHARPERIDPTDDLVAGDDRQMGVWQIAVDHMQVGAAHPAGGDLHPNLAAAGLAIGEIGQDQGRSKRAENHSLHESLPSMELTNDEPARPG